MIRLHSYHLSSIELTTIRGNQASIEQAGQRISTMNLISEIKKMFQVLVYQQKSLLIEQVLQQHSSNNQHQQIEKR